MNQRMLMRAARVQPQWQLVTDSWCRINGQPQSVPSGVMAWWRGIKGLPVHQGPVAFIVLGIVYSMPSSFILACTTSSILVRALLRRLRGVVWGGEAASAQPQNGDGPAERPARLRSHGPRRKP